MIHVANSSCQRKTQLRDKTKLRAKLGKKVRYQRSSSFHSSHSLTECGKQFGRKHRDKPHALPAANRCVFVRELVLVKVFAVMICIYVDFEAAVDRRRHSRRGV